MEFSSKQRKMWKIPNRAINSTCSSSRELSKASGLTWTHHNIKTFFQPLFSQAKLVKAGLIWAPGLNSLPTNEGQNYFCTLQLANLCHSSSNSLQIPVWIPTLPFGFLCKPNTRRCHPLICFCTSLMPASVSEAVVCLLILICSPRSGELVDVATHDFAQLVWKITTDLPPAEAGAASMNGIH